MDGKDENISGYKHTKRPLAASVCPLPTKLPADDLYEPEAGPELPPQPPQTKTKTLCGQTLSSFPQYRRANRLRSRLNLSADYQQNRDENELCAGCWRKAHAEDSWHVQARAMIHVCGPACWKYNKNGTRICRHHCYHITTLEPDPSSATPAEKPLKLRRDGRPLNNQLYIQEDASKGQRGWIVPVTVIPFDTITNYTVADSLRCNYDNQSLLHLPPGSVLKLMALPNINPKPEYSHMERKDCDLDPRMAFGSGR